GPASPEKGDHDEAPDDGVDGGGQAEHEPPRPRDAVGLGPVRVDHRGRAPVARGQPHGGEEGEDGDRGPPPHECLQKDGPTGSGKSPWARRKPSVSMRMGSWGRAAAAGPKTGLASSSTSNADWWQGQSSWWVSAW